MHRRRRGDGNHMFSGHCLPGPHRAEKPRHFLVEKPSRIEAFIRKPWMIGFPTGDFSPYAYQVGVSLVPAQRGKKLRRLVQPVFDARVAELGDPQHRRPGCSLAQ